MRNETRESNLSRVCRSKTRGWSFFLMCREDDTRTKRQEEIQPSETSWTRTITIDRFLSFFFSWKGFQPHDERKDIPTTQQQQGHRGIGEDGVQPSSIENHRMKRMVDETRHREMDRSEIHVEHRNEGRRIVRILHETKASERHAFSLFRHERPVSFLVQIILSETPEDTEQQSLYPIGYDFGPQSAKHQALEAVLRHHRLECLSI